MNLLLFVTSQAQIVITTYYVIPPTSGCNGVWAISASQLQSCAMPITWSPPTCLGSTQPSTIGDTTFFSICEIPCTIATSDGCYASANGSTAVDEKPVLPLVLIGPNPVLAGQDITVWIDRPADHYTVSVINLLGQTVFKNDFPVSGNTFIIPTEGLGAGMYVIQMSNGAGMVSRRVVLTN
ncbi:MAG: hypothetical protein FD123_1288 [Bacteroidetes bacterium]|nr:MAG: hypothetical protein FD123_1288 [Bacteroidota bacterium]